MKAKRIILRSLSFFILVTPIFINHCEINNPFKDDPDCTWCSPPNTPEYENIRPERICCRGCHDQLLMLIEQRERDGWICDDP